MRFTIVMKVIIFFSVAAFAFQLQNLLVRKHTYRIFAFPQAHLQLSTTTTSIIYGYFITFSTVPAVQGHLLSI